MRSVRLKENKLHDKYIPQQNLPEPCLVRGYLFVEIKQ